MYQASVPVFSMRLKNLAAILEKGAASPRKPKDRMGRIAQQPSFPDMFPLIRQVQIASDSAKGGSRDWPRRTAPLRRQ